MGKLSPLEIKRQQFKKVIRGYDTEEVDVFLEMISEKFENLMEKNDEFNSRVIKLETKLDDYQKNEKNINEILSRTREMQEEASQNLKKQEEIILKDAEFKAVEILENARKEVRQIREEVLDLQHKKDSFVSRLKYLIHSYLDLLKMLEAENLIDENEQEAVSPKSGIASTLLRSKRKASKNEGIPDKTKEDGNKQAKNGKDKPETEKEPGEFELIDSSKDEQKTKELNSEIFVHDISNLIDKIDKKEYDDDVNGQNDNNDDLK